MDDYEFTHDWFEVYARDNWDQLIPMFSPSKILEIGCFEGRSTTYLIEEIAGQRPLELHCIDSFTGELGYPGQLPDMSAVESRFRRNVEIAVAKVPNDVDLHIHKGYSYTELAKLLASGIQNYFDFVYVDASHQSPDVLLDALLAYRLTRVGGFIGFDDYTWRDPMAPTDVLRAPKLAIDLFANVYQNKVDPVQCPISQLYVRKVQ